MNAGSQLIEVAVPPSAFTASTPIPEAAVIAQPDGSSKLAGGGSVSALLGTGGSAIAGVLAQNDEVVGVRVDVEPLFTGAVDVELLETDAITTIARLQTSTHDRGVQVMNLHVRRTLGASSRFIVRIRGGGAGGYLRAASVRLYRP